MALHPLWLWLGYDRVEGPIRSVERYVKSVLFDCHMCGNCVLGKTGMSCPMNCPKEVRNGPCGGVREDGSCVGQARYALCLGRFLGRFGEDARRFWYAPGSVAPRSIAPRPVGVAAGSTPQV